MRRRSFPPAHGEPSLCGKRLQPSRTTALRSRRKCGPRGWANRTLASSEDPIRRLEPKCSMWSRNGGTSELRLPLPFRFQLQRANQAEQMVGVYPKNGGCLSVVPFRLFDGALDQILLGLADALRQRVDGFPCRGGFFQNRVRQVFRQD